MIDIKLIRENTQLIREAAKAKNVEIDFSRILELDKLVRSLENDIQQIAAQKNEASKRIPQASESDRSQLIEEMRQIDRKADELKAEIAPISEELEELLHKVPNPALPDVKIGKNESENEIIKVVGEKTALSFEPKDHVQIGEHLDIIDIEQAGKVSGARFAYLKGDGALLEFALIQLVISTLTNPGIISAIAQSVGSDVSDKPFVPVIPPVMIRPEVFRRMARLSADDADERYYFPKDNLYLVGSAEHTLGPLHMDEILDEKSLPIRYIGFSTSFRREAGSHGKDTRGIIRVHQFDKLEMESFTTPEMSVLEQDFIVAVQEFLIQKLNLPYRVVKMCTGDMGAPDARQIDIEIWMPAQQTYRETHTSDLMTDYQARRLQTRFRRDDKSIELVHTNDATAIAIQRMIVAILENYQQEDGSVIIPEVLRPFMGGKDRIMPKS